MSVYVAATVQPGDSEPPDEWADSLLTLDDLEPGVGSVVIVHAEGRFEPAMHTLDGWVTPTTWLSGEWWTWFVDGTDIYLIHEGTEDD